MECDPIMEVREKSHLKEYIHSICTALGGFEKVTDPPINPAIQPNPARRLQLSYVTGDECWECLKDLRKLLRQEETSLVKPVRLLLAEWSTFSEDLMPILALHSGFLEDRIGRTCFELVAYMMTPVVYRPFSNNLAKEISEQEEMQNNAEEDNGRNGEAEVDGDDSGDEELSEDEPESVKEEEEEESGVRLSAVVAIKEHRHHQLKYKEVILTNKWIFNQIMVQVIKLLGQAAWTDEDERFLFTVLTFIKSLLCLEAPQENKSYATYTTQDRLLQCLHSSHMLEFLLSMMGSIQDRRFTAYATLITDIVYCIFRFVDLDELLTGLQEDGSVADASLSRDPLTEHTLAESTLTLNDLYSKPTRHSRFGGTNTFRMENGKTMHMFSPTGESQSNKLPKSGAEFAKLQINSIEHLLKLLKLKRTDTIHPRPRIRVDADHCHVVLHGPSRRLLLKFALQYASEVAISMFAATQRLAVGATTDDRGREAFLLMLTLNLTTTYLKRCNDTSLARKILPLLSGNSLNHYLMSAITEFKDSKCFKALAVALKAFYAWIDLLMTLGDLPESPHAPADEKVTKQLFDVGVHQLHNFVHDYALMRPFNDFFSSPFHHPFLIPTLIPAVFILNRAVKAVIHVRSTFARRKAPVKRPKKKQRLPPKKLAKKGDAEEVASNSDPVEKVIDKPADELANALFSDNDDDVVSNAPDETEEPEELPQSENDSDDTKKYKEQSLDFYKYLRSYTSDGVMRSLLIYLKSALLSAPSPSALACQPQLHPQLNRKLRIATSIMHQLLVELSCVKLLHKATYLHTLHLFETQCHKITQAFPLADRSQGLKCQVPPTLNYVGELKRLARYVFHNILESLKKDPWLLETLLPKSVSRANRRALAKPATPPPEEADPMAKLIPDKSLNELTLTSKSTTPILSAPLPAKPSETIPQFLGLDDDFDDEFFGNLYV